MGTPLRSVGGAGLWLALGGALGGALPLPAVDPGPPAERATAPAVPATPAPSPPTPAEVEVEGFADPCLAVRAVGRRLDELSATVEQAKQRFSRRYGSPIEAPQGFDPDEAERRWAATIEAYPDRVWSTVDCTLYPCVALVLVDQPRPTATVADFARRAVGLEHAWVAPETLIEGMKALDLLTIALVDEPLERPAVSWVHSLRTRVQDLHAADLRTAMQASATD